MEVTNMVISYACTGVLKTACGFQWCYIGNEGKILNGGEQEQKAKKFQ